MYNIVILSLVNIEPVLQIQVRLTSTVKITSALGVFVCAVSVLIRLCRQRFCLCRAVRDFVCAVSFCLCCEIFCSCREVFVCAVKYLFVP